MVEIDYITHARTHTQKQTHTQTHAYTHTQKHTHTHTYKHTHKSTHTHTHIHKSRHACTHTHTKAHTHTSTHARTHTHKESRHNPTGHSLQCLFQSQIKRCDFCRSSRHTVASTVNAKCTASVASGSHVGRHSYQTSSSATSNALHEKQGPLCIRKLQLKLC